MKTFTLDVLSKKRRKKGVLGQTQITVYNYVKC